MRQQLHEAAYVVRRARLLRKARERGVEVPMDSTIGEIEELIQQDEVARMKRR